MQITWLLDKYLALDTYGAEDELTRLKRIVTASGAMPHVREYTSLGYKGIAELECVVVYGSIQFVKSASYLHNPGPWVNWKALKCLSIYPQVGQHLLNSDYFMLPAGELVRRWDSIVAMYDGSIFLRPDRGDKSFGGFVSNGDPEANMFRNALRGSAPDDLIVIAEARPIQAEWRFFCNRHAVISGCLYKKDGAICMEPGADPLAEDLARLVIHDLNNPHYFPDPMFTVDICLSEGKMRLLEVNSFSCCGMYACDVERIVAVANDLAVQEMQELAP